MTDEPIRIERRDSIERLSRTYQFGAIASDRYLWERIEEISQMTLRDEKPLGQVGATVASASEKVEIEDKASLPAIPETVA